MHYDLCTLFDRNYLLRGLALHESLSATTPDFTLYILCMDDTCYEMLSKLKLEHVELISLREFEDTKLLEAKATRTQVEYCWTCTPSLTLYLLEKHPEMHMLTYIDADLYFFDDPAPAFAEMDDASIGIMEHRYSSRWAHMAEESGVYVVQFLSFKNDPPGLAALRWWRDRCNEWCYHRVENGKLGDQRYLDDWLERFPRVIVYEHKGAGLAPWNFERYRLATRDDHVYVDDVPLIFYHFHSFSILRGGERFAPGYPEYEIGPVETELLYKPYYSAIRRAIRRVREVDPRFAYGIDDATARAYLGRVKAQRRAPLVKVIKSVPPLRWAWNTLKRLKATRGNGVTPLAPGDQRESWKAQRVAEQQKALVERQLADPMAVPPFKTFIELVNHIDAENPGRTLRLVDIGCGVGHYSALLDRYFPNRFAYTGSDYSVAMIERAREMWPSATFIVDDILESHMEYTAYDVILAGALVDVIEDFWKVVDTLMSSAGEYLILHRQRLTGGASYSTPTPGYEGQTTYATFINGEELEERARAHGLRLDAEATVSPDVLSFLFRREQP
jgi:SAM-dependent methyltransferase